MKKILFFFMAMLVVFVLVTPAQATLITIGTATYTGLDYNLIWDDDNNGNSVVWLDYSNDLANWTDQNTWASGLGGAITEYNIDSGYNVNWNSNDWRLPTAADGPYVFGNDGTTTAGYNITNSEMGHLYYTELGNTQASGLSNTGDFQNLSASWYWSGTVIATFPNAIWHFNFGDGGQDAFNKDDFDYGLAVRSGDVTATAVPEPTTIALLGIGLAGLAGVGVRRRLKKTKQ